MARFLQFVLLAVVLSLHAGCGPLIDALGGAWRHQPEQLAECLTPEAMELVRRAFEGLEDGVLVDHHVHLVGTGTSGSGAWVNPAKLRFSLAPDGLRRWLTTQVYLSACDISDRDLADEQYLERLVRLTTCCGHGGRWHLLAFDHCYHDDGTIDWVHSEFHTPNEYVMGVCARYPELFVPVISVHPYRADWKVELDRWAAEGARYVKWLPNAQGMDPADPRCDDFYRALKAHGMVLLTHVGEEQAVDAHAHQELGNPLRLRRALDIGVRVIMAHCGSLGENLDLDDPDRPRRSSFDLFMRLMDEPGYDGLLFGDISAMTQSNRLPRPLLELMAREDLHPRLVNGSDYPLPAINCVIRTADFVRLGLITPRDRRHLNQIYDCNPLLFDFVLKRTLRTPGTGERLIPDCVFLANQALP